MKKILFPVFGFVFDTGAAGLEIGEIGTGGYFHIAVPGGHPHFDIVGLGGGERHIAAAQQYHPVMEVQFLQNDFGIAG